MTDYRKAYGLPERYFLSLGRMVGKKNLATLVSAYARYVAGVAVAGTGGTAGDRSPRRPKKLKVKGNDVEKNGAGSGEHGEKKHGAGSMEQRANLTENCKLNTEHCAPALVFVGSGELEGALREQARGLGLRVVDRTDWKAGEVGDDNSENRENGRPARWHADVTGETPVPPARKPLAEPLNSQPSTLNEEKCGTVFFYGFRQIEENPVFYALAEAFVLPSLKEEWGLVVNEAMACSLPVIVSRAAGCAEDLLPGSESRQCSVGSVQSGENAGSLNAQPSSINSLEERSNGFVFDPRSSDALCEALRRIADPLNPKRSTLNAAAMGCRSREIVAQFSCENFARQALRAAEAASA